MQEEHSISKKLNTLYCLKLNFISNLWDSHQISNTLRNRLVFLAQKNDILISDLINTAYYESPV